MQTRRKLEDAYEQLAMKVRAGEFCREVHGITNDGTWDHARLSCGHEWRLPPGNVLLRDTLHCLTCASEAMRA